MSSPELSAAVNNLQAWTSEQRDIRGLVGLSVSVSDGAETEVICSGVQNVDTDDSINPSTRFAIASQTKPVTAAVCMSLIENDKLCLDDVAGRFLSPLSEASDERLRNVTVGQLLQHTAGLSRDMQDAGYWDLSRPFPTREEVLVEVKDRELVLDPGQMMKYSNVGYALLGLLIEEVAEQSYEDAAREMVLDRLELDATGFTKDERTATGHRTSGGAPIGLDFTYPNAFSAATGLISDAHDVHEIYRSLTPGNEDVRVLGEEAKILMSNSRVKVPNSNSLSYSYGLDYGYVNGVEIVGHGGGYHGFLSFTLFDAEHNSSVAVFSNSIEADAIQLAMGVMSVVAHFREHGAPDSELLRFEGDYSNMWQIKRVTAAGDKLFVNSPGQYQPFGGAETLTRKESVFYVSGANGFESEGECVVFDIEHERMIYAGRKFCLRTT